MSSVGEDPGFRHLPAFLDAAEVARLLAAIAAVEPQRWQQIGGRGGLGPRYRVLDGEAIAAVLPAVVALREERVGPLLCAHAATTLQPLASPRRAMRVQVYERREHGFRWHFDGHGHTALLTLRNDNGGETQMLSPRVSRWLRPLVYALYPVPQLFSLLPRRRVLAAPGDLMLMRGREILHRGVTRGDGSRVLLVFAYTAPGLRPNRLHDAVARWLNFPAEAPPRSPPSAAREPGAPGDEPGRRALRDTLR